MASIVQRNKSYAVVYYITTENGRKKQKWETYYSLEKAKQRKEEIENPITFLGNMPRANTLSELLDEFVKFYGQSRWSLSTYDSNTSLMKRYIIPFIGKVRLSQIDARMMNIFYQRLRQTPVSENKYNPGKGCTLTANHIFEVHKLLRSVFYQAVNWGYFQESPVKHICVKKAAGHPIDILTPDQVLTLINRAVQTDRPVALAIQLAFVASLRKGELLALKWEDISFEAQSVKVSKELARVSTESLRILNHKDVYHLFPEQLPNCKTRLVIKAPKTEASVRTVYLPESLLRNLAVWRDEQRKQKLQRIDQGNDYDLIFALETGRPLQEKNLSKRFHKLLDECGLPRVVFHSLRHTSTSYKLILSGGDIKAVQGDNGHAKPDMVLNVYARIMDKSRKILSEQIEESFYSGLKT